MATHRLPLAALLLPLAASLGGCLQAPESETVAPPYPVAEGIIDTGLQIPALEAAGWEVCHAQTYAESGLPILSILAECEGRFLMLGCGTEDGVLQLAAADARSAVATVDAGISALPSTVHHVSNGVGWYLNTDGGTSGDLGSWGFFPAGEGVSRDPCDSSAPEDVRRLCWMTDSGSIAAGGRCGAVGGEPPGAGVTRYVLVHPGSGTVPNPFAQATPLTLGTLSPPLTISDGADLDYFAFTVAAGGQQIRIQTFDATGAACDPLDFANRTGGSVDTYLRVYKPGPVFFLTEDDTGNGPDSPDATAGGTNLPEGWCEDIVVSLPEGTNYVAVGGWPNTYWQSYSPPPDPLPPEFPFTYTLKVSVVTPP